MILLIMLIFWQNPMIRDVVLEQFIEASFLGLKKKGVISCRIMYLMINDNPTHLKNICSEEAMADPSTLKNIPCRSDFNLAAS